MQVIAAVAEFWRDLLIERTQAGLQRALAEGKTLGRKPSLTEDQQAEILIKINKEGGGIYRHWLRNIQLLGKPL